MKVPLHVRRNFDQWQPFIRMTIIAPRVRPIPIEAVVDTGSPWIALSPKDLLMLNVSHKRLRKPKKYIRISFAGHKFDRLLLGNVNVRMRDEKGQIVSVDLPSISALWPTKKKWPDEIKHIPSVLGSDFLTTAKFALYFDPSKQIAFLEKEN